MPAHFRGIDGLRALAILGVIAFHTRPSLLQGGFIGVTMFFVITGFLATRSVLNMVDRTGSFGYGRYLIRRITRLWPVMLATIAVVPWLTWMFAPSLLQKVVSDSLPSALFASNWVYIFRKVPYFEAAGLPSPLTHLWFLGVTMQFYLVWPLLMVVLGKITKSKWVRSMAILVIMAASTADMVLLFDPANTSRVYYGTDTRLAELAAGALLAIWIAPSSRGTEAAEAGAASQTVQIERQAGDKTGARLTIVCNVLGTAALAALLTGFWFANGYLSYMYQGGYLITAFISLCALACAVNNDSIWSHVLGCAPLRYIGSRSFSLYVMHYPLLQFMNPATRTQALPWWGWVLEAVVVLAASEAFYQLVEAARKSVQMPRSQHAKPVKKPAKPEPESSAINAANGETNTADANKNGSDSQPPIIKPIAEKVPNNLDISKYAYDPATESCNADMMMVGDSVTSGTSDAIQAAFPNAFIDGLPNRQLPQAVDVYQQDTAAGHSGSVVVFGLGTNGVISNEQEVQQLIDLTGGKPTYFITIRMPYPWQENNNNTMLREAAKKNKNVGIIDWHGYSEGHSEYLNDDGIHPNMTGAYAYATMIRQAVCGQ